MLKKKYFVGLLFWLALISYLSLVQLSVSGIPKIPMMDKLVHFGFHFILASLLSLSLNKEWNVYHVRSIVVFTFLFSIGYGGGIELIQDKYTVSRYADWNDVLANTIGCGIGISTMLFFKLYKTDLKSGRLFEKKL